MTGIESSLLEIIRSNVDASNRWSVSVTGLCTLMTMSKDEITTALRNLENERYIDQFTMTGTADEVFGIRLTDK